MNRVSKSKKLGVMRKLLRRCFRNVAPAIIPLEVWWDIVLGTDLRAMPIIAQTSKAFWQLVEEIRRRNLRIALEYRRIDQIPLAKRCLTLCANHGIPEAMFHIGYAKQHGGFGFKKSYRYNDWIQKASDVGYPLAMAITAYSSHWYNVRIELVGKVLLTKDPCAIGYIHSPTSPTMDAMSYFKASANAGNEFGQYHLACCYANVDYNYDLCLYWHKKAAEQGHVMSQHFLYKHYMEQQKYSKTRYIG